MAYKAAEDLLELINMHFKDKTLYLSQRTRNMLSVVKVIDNADEIDIQEGDTWKFEDAY